nr:biopolymer transporter ExbD [Jannaschia sp. CCS1]
MPVKAAPYRRRALSMTSLIDVIFLLLLFFMLTSTFTRFSEIQLSAAGSGTGGPTDAAPLFLTLAAETVSLNGTAVTLSALPSAIDAQRADGATLLVSAADDVTSQRLVDLLVALASVPDLSVTVLD